MKQLRQEDLSLNHYIRNEVLKDFIETEKNVPLVYLDDLSQESGSAIYQAESYMDPSPISNGRGWVYTDSYASYTEQTDSVIVYDSLGTVISGAYYNVDYIDGRVIFPNTSYNPAAVTYRWYYVSMVEEWNLVQASEVPVVVVDISGFTKDGFQLGGGKIVPRKTNI